MDEYKEYKIMSDSKEYNLLNGKVVRYDYDFWHSYWNDKRGFVTSVTQINDIAAPKETSLMEWYKNSDAMHIQDKTEQGKSNGTEVHKALDDLCQGKEIDISSLKPRAKEAVASFTQWIRHFQPQTLKSERVVFYDDGERFFAGTIDAVCKFVIEDGKTWMVLIDYKNAKQIGFSYWLQVLAYKAAYEQSYGEKIDEVAILQLGTAHKTVNSRKPYLGKYPTNGMGWAWLTCPKHITIEDWWRVYELYRSVNGGIFPEPRKVPIYAKTFKLMERSKDSTEIKLLEDDIITNREE
jgi:hypothetical protein